MARQQKPQLGKVRQELNGVRGAIVMIVVFSLFVNILMLTGPLFMLQIYDRVLTSNSVPTLVALAILVIILYGLYGFLEYIRGRVLMRVGRTLEERLADKAAYSISYHALNHNSQIRTQPANDLTMIRQFLSSPGPFAFLDLPWAPVYLGVVFMLHFVLGVAATIAALILATFAIINSLLVGKHLRESQQATFKAQRINEETRRNVEVTTVMGMASRMRDRWRNSQFDALDAQTSASDRGGLITATSKTLRLVFQSGILGLGAYLAIKQEITPGTMIAASIIMSRALAPVEQVVAQWQSYVNFKRAWKRLDETLAITPEPSDKMPLPQPKGHLKVEGLMAFAPGTNEPILSRVDFELPPGSGLGIIGPTGAGKSTLARAIIGLWPNIRGEVKFDGATINQWDMDELGKHIGYLSQDVELFEGSIGQNIARFDPEPDPEKIVKAAQAAIVHELVLSFPDGYNTMIGENGANISAGQRQRIGLARALYGDPKIIVMDEPNANLDAEGEQALVKAMAETRKRGGTVIVIAHRPSAISVLSSLMVIKDGKVVAAGPKEEVLKKVLSKPIDDQGKPGSLPVGTDGGKDTEDGD